MRGSNVLIFVLIFYLLIFSKYSQSPSMTPALSSNVIQFKCFSNVSRNPFVFWTRGENVCCKLHRGRGVRLIFFVDSDWLFAMTHLIFFQLNHPHQDGILHFKVSCGHQLITFSGCDVQAVNL